MKSGENCSSDFKEKDNLKNHNFIHVYNLGARAGNTQGTKV